MNFSDIELMYPGKPCGIFRIRAIEKKIGRKLPKDYRKFIMQTGGGELSGKNAVLPGIQLAHGEELESEVELILGNGHPDDYDQDLTEAGIFLAEEWEIPSEVLLIGNFDSGMHECIVINYDLEEFPVHSILYLNNDFPGEFTLIAESFTEFLEMLEPSAEYNGKASKYRGQEGLYLARHGSLGEMLRKAIAASPYEDMEMILRRAAEGIASKDCLQMYCQEESCRFQDLLFFLSQPFGGHYSLESWLAPRGGSENGAINEADLLHGIFLSEHGWSGLVSFRKANDVWWERRTSSGVLVETPDGYRFKDDYIEWLVETFR
ncbi:SMI1/KNR4 family protein [Corynebacterium sp. 320]|uniref:SMI1/KNR4 family protein n=1 Tax=Corynebacterium TaxID=1716 RepID=UPI00125CAC4F|nr:MULTISPECIES: SMI1/KNR4 family protein [Corynebacterium]KAB1503876.1 SMI1/KNR4 family protein [Corynebacterium sp. 320]KAB1553025.1 SMI1/KNR4 family protein [Corynebacterium sp. 321]KAB1553755.1 SMI1/KNR4 family protein [Corynebacterium sp. 319]KAB3528012.1 SMI1/KNR4 family protein [Corynebacterium sp. 250]KAB3540499.1 SMI1/KNR4 family protein [Corynebacterium sp. 366]